MTAGHGRRAILIALAISFCYFTAITWARPEASITATAVKPHRIDFTNGTKYLIRTRYGDQDSYATVHDDAGGTVDAQYLIKDDNGYSPYQIWSIAPHPIDHFSYHLVQDAVPFNQLSGYENKDDSDPPLFPRPISFNEFMPNQWQIRIRIRYCLRFLGRGWPMDVDDCQGDYYYEPEKLWDFIPVPIA